MMPPILRVSLAAVAGLAALAPVCGAQDPAHASDAEKHPITITGCVRAGVDSGTFMLMNVEEVNLANRAQGVPIDGNGRDVLYILNSSEGLDKEVGQRVEVIGTVDLTDKDKAQMKVTDDETKKMDRTIEIKGDRQTVTVKTDTKPGVGPDATSSAHTTTEPNRVLYRLDVKSIRRVRSRVCDSVVKFRGTRGANVGSDKGQRE
jgi:hypothetical protein